MDRIPVVREEAPAGKAEILEPRPLLELVPTVGDSGPLEDGNDDGDTELLIIETAVIDEFVDLVDDDIRTDGSEETEAVDSEFSETGRGLLVPLLLLDVATTVFDVLIPDEGINVWVAVPEFDVGTELDEALNEPTLDVEPIPVAAVPDGMIDCDALTESEVTEEPPVMFEVPAALNRVLKAKETGITTLEEAVEF